MSADTTLQFAFAQVLDWIRWTVEQLQRIPTGFGISLWTFLIVTLIITIVTVAVVNIVRVAPDSAIDYSKRQKNEARRAERAKKK